MFSLTYLLVYIYIIFMVIMLARYIASAFHTESRRARYQEIENLEYACGLRPPYYVEWATWRDHVLER